MLRTGAHLDEFFLPLLGDITGGSEAWKNNLQPSVCQQTSQTNNSRMQRTERRQGTLISSVCVLSSADTLVNDIKCDVRQVQADAPQPRRQEKILALYVCATQTLHQYISYVSYQCL